MPNKEPLTFEQLNEAMAYDPATGIFTWKTDRTRRYRAGMQIGNIKSRTDEYGVKREYVYVGLLGQQMPAARVAWMLTHGEWPKTPLQFKDGNSMNLRIDNLKEVDYPTIVKIDTLGRKRYKMRPEVARKFGLKRYYGLSMETYNLMLAAQNGVCAICKGMETYKPKSYAGPKALSVDHNHETGAIRGLLCSNCNYIIGHCKEDRDILIEAIKYLDKHAGRDTKPTLTVVPTEEPK